MAWDTEQDVKFMKWESLFADMATVGLMSQQVNQLDELNRRLAAEQAENARMRADMEQDREDQHWFWFNMWLDTDAGRAYTAWEDRALMLLHEMDEGAKAISKPLDDDLRALTWAKAQNDPRWRWAADPRNVQTVPKDWSAAAAKMNTALTIAAIVFGLSAGWYLLGGASDPVVVVLCLILAAAGGIATLVFLIRKKQWESKISEWQSTHIDPADVERFRNDVWWEWNAAIRRTAPTPLMAWGGIDAINLYGVILDTVNNAPNVFPRVLPLLPDYAPMLSPNEVPALMPRVRAALAQSAYRDTPQIPRF